MPTANDLPGVVKDDAVGTLALPVVAVSSRFVSKSGYIGRG
jgi:hypothetical protein